jgi:hypothetical protein
LATNNIKFPFLTTKTFNMSFFNLFRRNANLVINQEATTEKPLNIAESARMVDQSLFVDEQAPEIKIPVKKQVNHIETFMDQNFEWQGCNDGYSYPESEYLENKLKLIKADFRFAVDKYLDAKRSELGELRLHVIRTAGISDRLEAQLNEKIKFLEINIHELDMQKILAVEDEGIVASAVHAYRLGFIKGVEKFQQEKLFAGSTGLYN